MTQEELIDHLNYLEQSVNRFDLAKRKQTNQRKQADRNKEQRIMDNEILVIENYLRSNPELNALFSENRSHFEYDEAFTNNYFSRDFARFIAAQRDLQ